MLGGKAGLVHVHMGIGEAQLQPLYDTIEVSNVPITQFLPTHMERNPSLVNAAKSWVQHGGFVDFTAGEKVCKQLYTNSGHHNQSQCSACY